MRSPDEQVAGLDKVARRVAAARANCCLSSQPGDVMALSTWCAGHGGRTEIVYASGGYDEWREGDLTQADLSEEAAAEILIREYQQMKASPIQ